MHATGMLWPHCRIGIALSGGVDSFVLTKVMQIRQKIVPFPFEIMVIHLNPGFDPALASQRRRGLTSGIYKLWP